MIIYKVKKLEILKELGLCATIHYKGEKFHLWLENDGSWTCSDNRKISFRPCYDEYDKLVGFVVVGGITLCDE